MRMTSITLTTRYAHQSGFSLIEIMIGLTIGAVALLAVLNVFEASEGYKRTVTGGGDAQTNGSIALNMLQRDIRQSGHGFNVVNLLGCSLTLPSGATLTELAPVTINHGSIPAGDDNTDTLLVAYGAAEHSTEGTRITNPPTGTTYPIALPNHYAVGHFVIAGAMGASDCTGTLTMGQVTGVTTTSVTVDRTLGANAGAYLFGLGARPHWRAYAVRNGNLTVCDFIDDDCTSNTDNPAIWRPVASHVVSLRAQYGRDTTTPPDGAVDTYDQTSATTSCAWARIESVRLAVVARSNQYEREAVATDGSEATWVGEAGAPIDLGALPDMAHYRYKKYEATFPLLNIIRPGLAEAC